MGDIDFINKTSKSKIVAMFICMIAVIGCICAILIGKGKETVNVEAKSYLMEISYQTSFKVNQRINTNIKQLNSISQLLSNLKPQEYKKFIQILVNHSAYQWIYTAGADGIIITDEGKKLDVSQYAVFKNAMNGKAGVNKTLVKGFDGTKGALYAEPYIKDGKKMAVLGWIPMDTMELLLNTETFDGTGFSHIVTRDGEVILKSKNKNVILNRTNIIESIKKDGEVSSGYNLSKLSDDMSKGKEGEFRFTIGKEERSIVYIPLDNEEWYIISVVPPSVYGKNIKSYMSTSVLIIAIVTFVLVMFLLAVVFAMSRKKNKLVSTIAFVDPITEGYTKSRMEIEVKEKMNHFSPFTFVSLDIKKFKLINDNYGTEQGNVVLRHVYNCIQKNLGEDECVARINADNFELILMSDDEETVNDRLMKIAGNINQFNEQQKFQYFLPIVCGSYIVRDKTENLIIIRDRANTARKKNEKNMLQPICVNNFFVDFELQKMIKEKEMENAMEKALEDREFIVYLQPKVGLESGKIIGAEALVRWQHPGKGLIPPDEFIPLFEKNGFILKLDLYVFEQVCELLHKWKEQGRKMIPISVNVSRSHLNVPDFLKNYKNIQMNYGIPSEYIELELTETVVFENLHILKNVIDDIHKLGYQCSMDDFGSGYSSLNVLKEVPVDSLKIDKIFFNKESNKRSDDIVETILQLAKKLDMSTVAEGVETLPQLEMLCKMKCDIVQGYIFNKPMPSEDFEELIKNDPTLMTVSHNNI